MALLKKCIKRAVGIMKGQLLLNEPMSEHTAWRVGGSADRFYRPSSLEEVSEFLKTVSPEEPIFWLGLGSNLLVRDGGIRGTVIATQKSFIQIEKIDEVTVRAEAGVSCATFARYCARAGLSGAEFLAGIPGTIGGALRLNAGCHGGETWERVVEVEVMSRAGQRYKRSPEDYRVEYRQVTLKDAAPEEWFLAGYFRLLAGDKETSLAKIRALLAQRAATQPLNEPNCGSTFRNPPGDSAGRLIEACGLKGFQIGGARISEKHANFIVNVGNATAVDIEKVMTHIQSEVKARFNIFLEPEIHVVGVVASPQ